MRNRNDSNGTRHLSSARAEMVNARGEVFGAQPPTTDTLTPVTFADLDHLQDDDGWIVVADYIRLTLVGIAATQDQAVDVQYKCFDDDEAQELVAETVIDAGSRTELISAEDIEGVAFVRVRAAYDSADGGTLKVGGVLK